MEANNQFSYDLVFPSCNYISPFYLSKIICLKTFKNWQSACKFGDTSFFRFLIDMGTNVQLYLYMNNLFMLTTKIVLFLCLFVSSLYFVLEEKIDR